MTALGKLRRQISNVFTQPPFWSIPDDMWRFTSDVGMKETIGVDFGAFVQKAYKANGIVFACILARLMVFSEVRFQWQRITNGRPAGLFGTQDLGILERPWPGGTTGELTARMEQDVSLAGNAYDVVVDDEFGRRIRRLRPDWVTILTGSPTDDPFDYRARVVGYVYQPKAGTRRDAVTFAADEVAHYSPIPDPEAQWRGMSWLTPVIDEISADKAATKHKLKFFEHGSVPGLIISYDKDVSSDVFNAAVDRFEADHSGTLNAYKTLHLGGGADPKTLGADLKQLDFKVTQGAGETRIAAAAGVHPVIAGFSEGLAGSSLNAGNFSAARRRFADMTIRPLWRIAAASLETIVPPPDSSTRLWYDDRHIAALRADAQEEAEIRQTQATAIRSLLDAGFTPESSVVAVMDDDFPALVHSGLFSVQLQAPGSLDIDQDQESDDDDSA